MDEDLCNKEASKRKCSLWELIEIDVKEKKKIHGDRKNECNQCEYTSSNTESLRIHFMTHSREKSNKCNQCDFASSRADNFRTHLKTHSGEKSNKCSQCDYASSYASALKTHLKIHSVDCRKVKQMQPM